MALEYLTFYQDRFRGGCTGGGFALPYDAGAYSGTITVNIPATATIRKAYLFASRLGSFQGNPSVNPINVTFNGSPAPFNSSNNLVPNFIQPKYGAAIGAGPGPANVHVKDVTNNVTPGQNTYTISVPSQPLLQNRFTDFYLLVAFNEPVFPFINVYAFINKLNLFNNLLYPISVAVPINTSRPVGLSLMLGYLCNNSNQQNDGYTVTVNSTTLGSVGGPNPNTPPCSTCTPPGGCAGPHGDFYYYNNVLTGINGSSNNLAMAGADCLSNLQTILAPGATSFNLGLSFTNSANDNSNNTWAMFLAYMDGVNAYECFSCEGLGVTNIFSTQVLLNWANCQNAASFVNIVQWRPVGNPTWTQSPALFGNTQYQLTGLTPGTNYEWQVINLDTNGTQCEPSGISFFSTP